MPGIIWLSLLEEMKVYSNVHRLGSTIAEYSQQTDASELLTAIGIPLHAHSARYFSHYISSLKRLEGCHSLL